MIRIATELGNVTLTPEYFADLVGVTAGSCYGVKGLATSGAVESMRSLLFGSDFSDMGVRVSEREGSLNIELHIKIVYGVNISAIVESIANKVKYAVEQSSGLKVGSVDVYVDEMVAE
ncbi:MAG: Asp23/Gls24 family envelope stress response protein [Oscillospiraceae bacterium]|nr:Asp23/Gls24 family envelope stress response protein [Oscillospiraceae bacterium]